MSAYPSQVRYVMAETCPMIGQTSAKSQEIHLFRPHVAKQKFALCIAEALCFTPSNRKIFPIPKIKFALPLPQHLSENEPERVLLPCR